MRYLGVAKKEKGLVVMPDSFGKDEIGVFYEAFEIDGQILLMHPPVSRKRQRQIKALMSQSMDEHRTTLKGMRD